MLNVNYIYNAGFLVETDDAVLLFNYTHGSVKKINAKKPLYVFLSSCSQDHFDNDVFHLGANRNDVNFLVAKDAFSQKFKMKFFFKHSLEKKTREKIIWTEPNRAYNVGNNVRVRTFSSTDTNGSVAYLVETRDGNIFHAGYLNDWSWPGSPDEMNIRSKKLFEQEVQKLRNVHINVAFLFLNSLQENMYADGFDYMMRNVDIDEVYPMNFKDDKKIIDFLIDDDISSPYREKIKHTTEYTSR